MEVGNVGVVCLVFMLVSLRFVLLLVPLLIEFVLIEGTCGCILVQSYLGLVSVYCGSCCWYQNNTSSVS